VATSQAYTTTNLIDPTFWAGDIVRGTSTELVISDGTRTAYYDGYGFGYSGRNLVTGTMTGFSQYTGNSIVGEIYGFSISAAQANFYLSRGDLKGFIGLMLQRDDTIYGSTGNDKLAGYDGYDTIYTRGGSDIVDGGRGIDTVVLSGRSSDYTISSDGAYIFLDKKNGTSDNDFINVERIRFDNGTLAVDINGNAGQAYRIYQAAFDRTPDTGGLNYWVNQLDKGASLTEVGYGFVQSAEFRSVYGSNPSNFDYVNRLYLNVLDRQGEAGGVNYWVGELNAGVSRAYVLASFADSPENVAAVAPQINTGIWLG
jgi:hypothetical protein